MRSERAPNDAAKLVRVSIYVMTASKLVIIARGFPQFQNCDLAWYVGRAGGEDSGKGGEVNADIDYKLD